MARSELRAHPNQHYTYRGRSVLVTGATGAVHGRGSEGFHHRNTRFLTRLVLSADGTVLEPFSGGSVGSDRYLAYAAVRWPRPAEDAHGEVGPGLYLEIEHHVDGGLRTEIRVRAHHPTRPARFVLGLDVDADFADTDEAERGERRQEAAVEREWRAADRTVILRYRHPDLDLATEICVEEAPEAPSDEGGSLRFPISLDPRGSARIVLAVEPLLGGERVAAPGPTVAPSRARRASRDLDAELPTLTTTNPTVAAAWETAVADLVSLPLGLDEGPAAPIAGLPRWQQVFGRDSLTVSWQALPFMPRLARDSLRLNAAWQGRTLDDWRDEEPGKMLHQGRWGPLSALGLDPHLRYYGDYATAPDFLVVLGQYVAWTGDTVSARSLLPHMRAAIDWIDRYADVDSDGLVEYVTRSTAGVKNQGWLDSGDAIVDEQGIIVENPIATSELQAYVYAGLGQAALTLAVLGDVAGSSDLVGRAETLRRRFHEAFWVEDRGIYASALGPDKRPIACVASNAGHLLAAGIVPAGFAARVAARLLEPDMFSGWGVRTLSADHPAFDPFSYHRGSVWPVEQATIAFGLARYARWPELARLAEGFFDSADLFAAHRLPEVMGGLARDPEHGHPGIYPNAHQPQAWSASAVLLMVQSLLGMRAFAPARLLMLDPHLPEWLPDLRLRGLRIGKARIDLRLRLRRDGSTGMEVEVTSGHALVLRQPVADSSGSLRARLGAGLQRIVPFIA